MKYADLRTARLYGALTAGERVNLVLQALKSDDEDEVLIARTVPPEQRAEFVALVDLLAATATEVGHLIRELDARLATLELLAAFVAEFAEASVTVGAAVEALMLGVPELSTADEAASRIAEDAEERIPLTEAVELVEELGGNSPTEARRAINALEVRGTVSYAEVCAVAGHTPGARPEWGASAVVVSGSDSLAVSRLSRDALRAHLLALLAWTGPRRLDGLRAQAKRALVACQTDHDVVAGTLAEISEYFAGELPLFLEDEELLEQLGLRIANLTDRLGPIERTDTSTAVQRLSKALRARAGLR